MIKDEREQESARGREGRRGKEERKRLTSLRDHSARLEGVVDTLDGVLLHGNEEARRELRVRSTGVEELSRRSEDEGRNQLESKEVEEWRSKRETHRRTGVGEVPLGHQVVGFDSLLDIVSVDTNSDSHDHVLGTLSDVSIDSKKVRSLEGLESEAVENEIRRGLIRVSFRARIEVETTKRDRSRLTSCSGNPYRR